MLFEAQGQEPRLKRPAADPKATLPHGPVENTYALAVGTVLISLGLILLSKAGLVTGGVAGLALVFSYLTGLPLGVFLVVLTVPALLLTLRSMGYGFAARTLLVTFGLAAMTGLTPMALEIASVSRAFADKMRGTITWRFATTASTMLAEVRLPKGDYVPPHRNDNEQFTYVISGLMKFFLGDEGGTIEIVGPGQLLMIPGGLLHAAEILENTFELDVFNTPRQDWIDGSDLYLQR